MKPWGGKDFDYRGYHIVNDKKNRLLLIYDPNGWCCETEENDCHAAANAVKNKIDRMIARHRH